MADPDEPQATPRRRWPWVVLFLLWGGCLAASVRDVGGYGDALAVPVLIPFVIGLLWLWRWEQARKQAGGVTYGEEIAKEIFSGSPFGLLSVLFRGPKR